MRRIAAFLAVNCANFGSEQLAGQLLGYKSGRSGRGHPTRNGIFSSRQVGTLLFDQVEKCRSYAGSAAESILDMADSQRSRQLKKDGRSISVSWWPPIRIWPNGSTHGVFRKFLYDRLKLFELTIPPLRERKDDIHPLCRYFFDNTAKNWESRSIQFRRISSKSWLITISPEMFVNWNTSSSGR
jgi:DNA-binding NtrC family response regulator